MQQPAHDLFGEVPVSYEEIDAWLWAVVNMDPTSPRAAQYVKGYDVPGKIRAAKLAGKLEEWLTPRQIPAHWWARFRWV